MRTESDMLPLTLLADDLTGAMDSGLQFALSGWDTTVELDHGSRQEAPVIALSTESRDLRPSDAVAAVSAVAHRLIGKHLFVKIDSTMRGNVGYELRTLLHILPIRTIVIAPAFPKGGRTLVDGQLLVDGRPLATTAFRSDPRWPMNLSHVPTYLLQQAGMEVGHLRLEQIAAGHEALQAAMASCPQRLIVADAASDEDLLEVARAIRALGPGWVPCGSAGLAQAWSAMLGPGPGRPEKPAAHGSGRVLLVIASRNPVTRAQMDALDGRACRATLQRRAAYAPEFEAQRLAQLVCDALEDGRDVILESATAELLPGGGLQVASILARAAAVAVDRSLVRGLVLSGGEVALAVCRALQVQGLRILTAIEPGIPGGEIIGGRAEGTRLVTKAGGFGSVRALASALHWLEAEA